MLRRAEDMRVVLLEAPHAREAGERAAELVAVQHAEVRQAQRQLTPRAGAVVEQETDELNTVKRPLKKLDPVLL